MSDNTLPLTKESNSVSLQCPMLNKTNYTVWSMCMKDIFNVHGVWDMIDPGTSTYVKKNNMEIALLFQSLPEGQIKQVGNNETAKEMWDAIKSCHLGTDRGRETRLQTLMSDLENLKMKETSTIDEFASEISGFASKAAAPGSVIEETNPVKKFLNGLPRARFIHMVASIEQVVDLKTIGFDDVVGRLKAYEERIKDEDGKVENQSKLMFTKAESSKSRSYDQFKGRSRESQATRGRGRGPGGGQGRGSGNPSQNRPND
ncbi:uncharacterized protein LOC143533943 [Bidens hawaiensis]|uniref:uncharacterized protein LOC143533943 n=1 Tax=Bidens hawaiensis TaxID=980011 RepID=UPI004048EE96